MKKNLHDNAPSPLSAVAQASRLVRRKAAPMALEQRFMFDGAAVVEAAAVLEPVVQEAPAPEPAPAPAPEPVAVEVAEPQTTAVTDATTSSETTAADVTDGGSAAEPAMDRENGAADPTAGTTSTETATTESLFVIDTDTPKKMPLLSPGAAWDVSVCDDQITMEASALTSRARLCNQTSTISALEPSSRVNVAIKP